MNTQLSNLIEGTIVTAYIGSKKHIGKLMINSISRDTIPVTYKATVIGTVMSLPIKETDIIGIC